MRAIFRKSRRSPLRQISCALALASGMQSLPGHAQEQTAASGEEEKAAEDPTKISTRVGAAYAGELSASGSLAIGPRFKINGRVARSGQWSLGASYLLPVAILTFAAGRSELDTGVKQTRYSLGGFVPLNSLGLQTGKWQVFVPFGYSYTNSRQPVTDLDVQDGIPMQISSNSGYVGLFTIRPLTQRMTLMAGGNFTKGTHGFSGYAVAGGVSYHLGPNDTVAVRASHIDNTFGQKQRIGVSYQHEF